MNSGHPQSHTAKASQDYSSTTYATNELHMMVSDPDAATKYHWLDLCRFAAALIVVLGHARAFVFVPFGSLPESEKTIIIAAAYLFTRIGNEAVVAFFLLSGFLVGGKAIERIAQGTFRPTDYAIDRITRIMLPLLPALLLSAACGYVAGENINFRVFVGNVFSLQGILVGSYGGNVPLWSLAYEVWFYTFIGIVGVIVLRRSLCFPAATALVLVTIIFSILSTNYLFCWLIGALAYICRPGIWSEKILLGSLMLCLYAIACIQIGSGSVSFTGDLSKLLRSWTPSQDVSRILLAYGLALLMQQLILLPPRNAVLFNLEAYGTKGAAFSYTLYLTHYPLLLGMPYLGIQPAKNIDAISMAIYLIVVVVCISVAWLLYLPFERNTTKVRRSLRIRFMNTPKNVCES